MVGIIDVDGVGRAEILIAHVIVGGEKSAIVECVPVFVAAGIDVLSEVDTMVIVTCGEDRASQ